MHETWTMADVVADDAALVPQFPVYAAVDRWRERTGRRPRNGWI